MIIKTNINIIDKDKKSEIKIFYLKRNNILTKHEKKQDTININFYIVFVIFSSK